MAWLHGSGSEPLITLQSHGSQDHSHLQVGPGFKGHFQGGSLTWQVSWCQLSVEDLSSSPRGPVHRVPECPLDLGVTSSRASHLEEGEPGRAYPFYGLASEVCSINSTL